MKVYAITDTGVKRTVNQDSYLCHEEPLGLLPNCFIIADGMGGHNAGDFASKFVIDNFIYHMRSSAKKTKISQIEESIKLCNEELIKRAAEDKELEGCGTTFVLASIENNELLLANIGDSRAYLVEDNVIKQITEDHSIVNEMVRNGELRKEEARYHPQKNVVLRAISTRNVVAPDFFKLKVKPGSYFLLCSDGLSDMLDEAELLKIINEYEEVPDIAEKMVVLANENGGKDNISLILARV